MSDIESSAAQSPELENLNDEIHKVRNDATLDNDRKGEKLVKLYRQKVALERPQQETEQQKRKEEFEKARREATGQEIPPESQAVFDEVERIETQRGEDYEENNRIIAEQGLKFFRGDKQRLYDFIVDNRLGEDPQALADAREFLLRRARRNRG